MAKRNSFVKQGTKKLMQRFSLRFGGSLIR
jgi:hypothetical protein